MVTKVRNFHDQGECDGTSDHTTPSNEDKLLWTDSSRPEKLIEKPKRYENGNVAANNHYYTLTKDEFQRPPTRNVWVEGEPDVTIYPCLCGVAYKCHCWRCDYFSLRRQVVIGVVWLYYAASEKWDDAWHSNTSDVDELCSQVAYIAEGDDNKCFSDCVHSEEAAVLKNKTG